MKIVASLVVALAVTLSVGIVNAADGNIDQASLSALGLSGMTQMTAAEGHQVRGTFGIVFSTSKAKTEIGPYEQTAQNTTIQAGSNSTAYSYSAKSVTKIQIGPVKALNVNKVSGWGYAR